MGLTYSKPKLIHISFTSELKSFICILAKTGFVYVVLHNINLTYYSIITFLESHCFRNYTGMLASPFAFIDYTFTMNTGSTVNCFHSNTYRTKYKRLQVFIIVSQCRDHSAILMSWYVVNNEVVMVTACVVISTAKQSS